MQKGCEMTCTFEKYNNQVKYRNPLPEYLEEIKNWARPEDVPYNFNPFYTLTEFKTALLKGIEIYEKYGLKEKADSLYILLNLSDTWFKNDKYRMDRVISYETGADT